MRCQNMHWFVGWLDSCVADHCVCQGSPRVVSLIYSTAQVDRGFKGMFTPKIRTIGADFVTYFCVDFECESTRKPHPYVPGEEKKPQHSAVEMLWDLDVDFTSSMYSGGIPCQSAAQSACNTVGTCGGISLDLQQYPWRMWTRPIDGHKLQVAHSANSSLSQPSPYTWASSEWVEGR